MLVRTVYLRFIFSCVCGHSRRVKIHMTLLVIS